MARRDARKGSSSGVPAGSVLTAELPDGLLEVPFKNDRPRIQRFDAGILLDLHMRRLARLSGAVDRGLAWRLHRLTVRRGHLDLGYSGVVAYARERLGLAPRTTQELVKLGRGLERHPLIDAALRDGRITWTAAAEALRGCGRDDEAEWVRLAETSTVRQLKDAVRRRRNDDSANDGGHGGEAGTPAEQDDAEEPVDPVLPMEVRTSGSVARLWDAALELCERVAGVPLRPAEAVEYVLADFLSGTAGPPADVDDRRSDAVVQPCWRRSRTPMELHPAEALGDLSLAEPYSAEVAAALALVDDDDVVGNSPHTAHELDSSARTLIAARNGVDLDLARLLRNFRSLGLHRHVGFDTFAEYVRERLAISSARAHMLARLDWKLFFLPKTSAAVRCGTIGLVAADQIGRVAQPETERAWIEAARLRSVSRLRKDVEWVLREAERSGWDYRWPPPPDALPSALDAVTDALLGGQGARGRRRVADAAEFEKPAAWIRVSADDDWRDRFKTHPLAGDPDWCDNAPFIPERNENGYPFVVDVDALRCRPGVDAAFNLKGCPVDAPGLRVEGRVLQMFAPPEASVGDVRVRFELHASSLPLWNRAEWVVRQRQQDGRATDAMVLREAAVAFLLTYLPTWFEAMETQDPVALRARFVCQMPGCEIAAGAGHHIRFKSQSGSDDAWNLEFLCFEHHIEGIHAARVRLYGRAPNALVAEIGLGAGGRPLERWVRWGPLIRPAARSSQAA